MISDFGHEVDENFAVLDYYTTSSSNSISMKMGLKGCPETTVRNYHYSLRNNTEEHGSQIVIQ
jgi:hypothetical protein